MWISIVLPESHKPLFVETTGRCTPRQLAYQLCNAGKLNPNYIYYCDLVDERGRVIQPHIPLREHPVRKSDVLRMVLSRKQVHIPLIEESSNV